MILLAKEVSSLGLAFYVCSPSKTNCGSRSSKKVIDCAYKDLHKYVQTRHSGQKHFPKVLLSFMTSTLKIHLREDLDLAYTKLWNGKIE